jgi:cytochrome P450
MTTAHPDPVDFPFPPAPAMGVEKEYGELRGACPVSRVRLPYGGDAWLVTGYEQTKKVLADTRFSRAAVPGKDVPRIQPNNLAEEGGLLDTDPPEHTRLRGIVARIFTQRHAERLRPGIQAITDGLLDSVEHQGGPIDLVQEFALPLPIATVVSELLGVPAEARPRFREWADATLSTTKRTAEEITRARQELRAYFSELIEQRRRAPADDLISAMVRARDEEGRLSESELVRMAEDIMIGGHETTANRIASFTYVLLTHPDQLDRLKADPSLITTAVEELVRYVPLDSASFARIAKEDVDLGGVTVRAGEAVFPALLAANRDGLVFTDPDRLDIGRERNQHVGFGHGVHHCLGAQLGRVELQVALGSLFTRFPGLRLAVPPEEIPWKSGGLLRGPEQLLVEW